MKKFALIGCGDVAAHHAENMLRIGELVAVCDVVPEKADAFASSYGAKAYVAFDDLLANEKDVDIIAVCTPTGFHAEQVIKSLQAKKHVLCESPLCLTSAAAWQMIETEKFCRRRLLVVTAPRQAALQTLKATLSEGRLGKVFGFQLHCLLQAPDDAFSGWKGKLFPGGGLLYTAFSQYIELLVQLFGEIAEVKGFGRNAAHQQSLEAEDTGTVVLQMQNGVLGTLLWSVNSRAKNKAVFTIMAENGTCEISGSGFLEAEQNGTEDPTLASPAENTVFSQRSTGSLKPFYEAIVQVTENGGPSPVGAWEGVRTVEAIEKIYKALS